MTDDFFESDAGKFISRAKCFLEAASVLDEKMLDGQSGMLFSPALHLVGHGLELLLKGCLLHNGLSKARAVGFGHRINDMWVDGLVARLRDAAIYNARIAHQYAISSGLFPDAESVADPVEKFEEFRAALGELHAEPKHFPIRYPTEQDRLAPRTPLLVGTLWRTADDYVKRPAEFVTDGTIFARGS